MRRAHGGDELPRRWPGSLAALMLANLTYIILVIFPRNIYSGGCCIAAPELHSFYFYVSLKRSMAHPTRNFFVDHLFLVPYQKVNYWVFSLPHPLGIYVTITFVIAFLAWAFSVFVLWVGHSCTVRVPEPLVRIPVPFVPVLVPVRGTAGTAGRRGG